MNINIDMMNVREELRKKYLETSGTKKLSDLYKLDGYMYRELRDKWLLLDLLEIEEINNDKIKEAIDKNRNKINWPNLYEYFDKRLQTEKDKPISSSSYNEIQNVLEHIEPYRQEMCNTYSAF